MSDLLPACPRCGTLAQTDSIFCADCGYGLLIGSPKPRRAPVRQENVGWCVYCGKPVTPRALTCPAHKQDARRDPFFTEKPAA